MAPLDSIGSPDARVASEKLPEGVVIDQELLSWIYKKQGKNVHAIATDRFLNKSKDQYNTPWLVRELVQNFVDHNRKHPGTLDGVECKKTVLKDGRVRFEIIGDWPYEDPTGTLSPHSDKPEGQENAGGNGIGLKQTAIRFLRDFDVDTFEIHGERWSTKYHLARAEEMNDLLKKQLAEQGQNPVSTVRHDWLVGEFVQTNDTGKSRYVIETRNPTMIKALDTFREVGVSSDNRYLANPDFENKIGSLTWVLPGNDKKPKRKKSEDTFNTTANRGRLFINGQVMSWERKGATEDAYWVGPEFMTLRLNNLKYDMSIDRPPVDRYALRRYVSGLIESMGKTTLIDQLKRSEPIWTTQEHGGAWMIVVREIIDQLKRQGFKAPDFATAFGDKKYLAYDTSLSTAQEEEFEKQGYILCPGSFMELGMQRASALLSQSEQARRTNKPDVREAERAMTKLTAEVGTRVATSVYPCRNARDFAELIRSKLASQASNLEYLDDKNIIRLSFPFACSDDLMYDAFADDASGTAGEIMYAIRSTIRAGLSANILANGYVTTKDLTAIFSIDGLNMKNPLFMKVIKVPGEDIAWSVDFVLTETSFKTAKASLTGVQEEMAARPPEIPPTRSWNDGGARAPEALPKTTSTRRVEVPSRPYDGPPIEGLTEVVDSLERVAGKVQKRSFGDTLVEQYRKLRGQNNNLAAEAGYLTGQHLMDILNESSQADVPASAKGGSALARRLEYLANQIREADESVENLDIVLNPTKEQLAQLSVMRRYLNLTTGAAIENDLFVFRGNGTLGVNIARRAIGIHEQVLKASFKESLSTMVHELAHNEFRDHDNGFMSMMQALSGESEDAVFAIAKKILRRQRLTKNEQFVMDARDQWDKLRG